jgi:hypothetical protein
MRRDGVRNVKRKFYLHLMTLYYSLFVDGLYFFLEFRVRKSISNIDSIEGGILKYMT